MYLSYWHLTRRPFESGIDATAYYPSETHQSSLLKLRWAVETGAAAAVLGGGSGTGKTLLVQLLRERLGEVFSPWTHLVFPQMSTTELLAYIAAEMQTEVDPRQGLDRIVRALGRRLLDNAREGNRAVLIVDEAHLLESARALETLRLLLNFEHQGRPALTLILVGQPALMVQVERQPQLDERVLVKCLLRPLSIEETMGYVQHRLAQAGARTTIFTPAALETIHRLSHGLPRRINRLCDLALLVGYAEEQSQLTDEHVAAIARELVELV